MAGRSSSDAINRATTPMKLVEENYEESREQQVQRTKALEDEQKTKSPFLIGTIDDINRRISNLDQKLQSYTELVVESRATDFSDDEYISASRPTSTEGRQLHLKREREAREVHRFAGLYTLKANRPESKVVRAFTPGISDRVKNISKISMNPSKTTVKKDDGKPKFVELHQYPGYDPAELTQLPNEISALQILTKVADAQPKLRKKLHYRPEFERLFYSQMSQAILQDSFWWYFQEKYQPSKQYQMKLFNRIAHNYVKLMTYARHPQYRESFLRDYPSLLAQAVYTAFCTTFPDSYRQYNTEFKEDLVTLVYEWVAGIRPAPNSWQSWNLEMLEPPNIKAREEMLNQAKDKKTSVLNFDFLESSNSQYTGSQSTINHLGTSMSSMSGMSLGARRTGPKRGMARRSIAQSSPIFSESGAIQQVAEEQSREERAMRQKRKLLRKKSSKNMMDPSKLEMYELLTPIHEFQEDEVGGKPEAKGSKMSTADAKSVVSMSHPRPKVKKESHPVGRGPEFVRNVFNIYGQSPLVAHFLRMKRLQEDAGLTVRIQRTEVESLPPVETKTYHQLIQDAFKGVRQLEKDYQSLTERDAADSARFIRKQKADMRDHIRRQKALLSKPREVKRLSDLLILELKDLSLKEMRRRNMSKKSNTEEDEKDEDSIAAGASAAVEAALQTVSLD